MDAAIALAKSLYPISGVADAVLEAWYQQAEALVGSSVWVALTTLARAHLLGHFAEEYAIATSGGSSGGGSVAGAIQSSKSETLSLTYGAWAAAGSWVPLTLTDAALAQTPGGRAFMMLRATVAVINAPVVG